MIPDEVVILDDEKKLKISQEILDLPPARTPIFEESASQNPYTGRFNYVIALLAVVATAAIASVFWMMATSPKVVTNTVTPKVEQIHSVETAQAAFGPDSEPVTAPDLVTALADAPPGFKCDVYALEDGFGMVCYEPTS